MKGQRATLTCSGLVIVKGDGVGSEILLVRSSLKRFVWGIPKGRARKNEQPMETAMRETYEETGIFGLPTMKLPDAVRVRADGTRVFLHGFLATQICGSLGRGDDENVDVAFFPISRLPPLHAYQRKLIEHAIDVILHERMRGLT